METLAPRASDSSPGLLLWVCSSESAGQQGPGGHHTRASTRTASGATTSTCSSLDGGEAKSKTPPSWLHPTTLCAHGGPKEPQEGHAVDEGTHLQLGLEEELLWALRAVVDLVLLPMHGKDVLLQLVGLDKDWTRTRPLGPDSGDTSPATSTPSTSKESHNHRHSRPNMGLQGDHRQLLEGAESVELSSATKGLCNAG